MKVIQKIKPCLHSLAVAMGVMCWLLTAQSASAQSDELAYELEQQEQNRGTIVRAHFKSLDQAHSAVLNYLALESEYEKGYLIIEASNDDIVALEKQGFRVEIDNQYLSKNNAAKQLQGASMAALAGIPGYACYTTVEETFVDAEAIVSANPTLATWTDVGNSWEKVNGFGGYDIKVLKLTNSAITGAKPKLFMNSAIHAREYATAGLTLHFVKYMIDNYGSDADATWILDHHEIHVMLVTNPDGRKKAEAGILWRKNTNRNYCGSTSNNRGADLNRNFTYDWNVTNGGGSSGNQCASTYRGPSAASEPEIQAIEGYVRSLWPDQRGPGRNDAAPLTTSGIHLDIHSHGRLVLWPWGSFGTAAPNATELQTLGRKFAYFNGHSPKRSTGLYETDGTSDGISYGELGVAGMIIELGTAFFQSCGYFNNNIIPDNMPFLIYAAKAVRTPYITGAGPDARNLALSAGSSAPGVPAGTAVTLTAVGDDTRYNNSNGTEPTQAVNAAEYYIDTPPWQSGASAQAMSASDGNFNSSVESLTATINTAGLSNGKHTVFVRSKDANNVWGVFSAAFLYISGPATTVPTADFSFTTNNLAVTFTDNSSDSNGSIVTRSWTFGDGNTSTATNPSHTYATAGTYTVGLTVTDNDGETDNTSKSVTVSDAPPISYCTSSAGNNNYEWIAGVNIASLNKTSAASSYSDFTADVVALNTGSTAVSLTPGFASSAYSEHWKVWIDLNQDGDFVDAGEQVFSGSGSSAVNGNLNIPASASKGQTRMRVGMQYNSALSTACGTFTYGEIEDYTADIQ